MSIRGEAYIVGAFEHPTRNAPDKSTNQLHAEIVKGALDDAGLSHDDIDGFFHAGDAIGLGPLGIVDYLGLKPRHMDSTDTGGSAPLIHVSHATQAIMAGKCDIAVVSLAGRARNEPFRPGLPGEMERGFERAHSGPFFMGYAMCAMRHMHEYGTTSEQLAWIKVAASHHAQHNPHALLREVVTVDQVVGSPMVADPLHRLDCCVVTDGGGAVIVTGRRSPGASGAPACACWAPARRRKAPTPAGNSTSPALACRTRGRRPSPRRVWRCRTSTMSRSTTASPSPC